MSEMRGCDLVVDYLIKEKTPYMFGYAGHGAVGLLDGVYHRQDEIKIVFPRIESAAGYMADAYFRATGHPDPRLHVDRPRPDAADGRDGERLLRLLGVHRDHRAGGDQPVRLRRASGGVPPLPGRLPERSPSRSRSAASRRTRSRTWRSSSRRRSSSPATGRPGPGPHRRPVRPLDPHRRRRGARARGALAAMLNWRTPGSPEAVAARARHAAEGASGR